MVQREEVFSKLPVATMEMSAIENGGPFYDQVEIYTSPRPYPKLRLPFETHVHRQWRWMRLTLLATRYSRRNWLLGESE